VVLLSSQPKETKESVRVSDLRLPLSAEDLARLERSYISAELAGEAGLFRVDSSEGGRLVGRNGSADYSGIIFPNRWPGETSVREYRLRRDNPEVEELSDGTQKVKRKYLSPPGARNLLYFAPDTPPNALHNIELPVLITEGEKKTLALSRLALLDVSNAARFLPIGIPGVWNWRGKVGKTTNEIGSRCDVVGPIPDLDRLSWQDRSVIIVFDANVNTNPSVANARRQLAKELAKRRASVRLVDLPEIENINGVDELLTIKGPAFVLQLLDAAKPAHVNVPISFRLSEQGVYFVDPTGEKDDTFICGPLRVTAATRNTDSQDWGRLLEFVDADGRIHEWSMPMSMLAGDGTEYRSRLLSMGLVISSSRKARELLTTYIQSSMPDQRVRCVSRVGWHDEAYVLPDERFGTGERVLYQSTGQVDHRFRVSGTLADWQTDVARHCVGNSRLVFAIACAFAGPLLGVTGEGGGGFHFRGKSSIGKSTALAVAGSVWGGTSNKGYIESWRATANALENVAELHNHGLLCLDEISECDPRTLGETAYMLANGIGKSRMSRGGNARPRLEWNLIFVSTGEQSLADIVAQSGKRLRGGQEIRMCDLEADAGKSMGIFEELNGTASPETLARHLSAASGKYYGTAIREYLSLLSRERQSMLEVLRELRSNFIDKHVPTDTSGEVRRAAVRFALVGAAGELAEQITRWPKATSIEAAARMFEVWMFNRDSHGHQDDENAIKQIRAFLELHGGSRFQDVSDPGTHVYNRAGFKRIDAEGETEYLILSEVFRLEVCKGYDVRAVLKLLIERGYLTKGDGRNFMKRETVPEIGRTRVYLVSRKILDAT
jgi:putative DNA primase/helicase